MRPIDPKIGFERDLEHLHRLHGRLRKLEGDFKYASVARQAVELTQLILFTAHHEVDKTDLMIHQLQELVSEAATQINNKGLIATALKVFKALEKK